MDAFFSFIAFIIEFIWLISSILIFVSGILLSCVPFSDDLDNHSPIQKFLIVLFCVCIGCGLVYFSWLTLIKSKTNWSFFSVIFQLILIIIAIVICNYCRDCY